MITRRSKVSGFGIDWSHCSSVMRPTINGSVLTHVTVVCTIVSRP